jgi:phosphatidylglycerophosphate synthase
MQAVMVIPPGSEKMLNQDVVGVPLLIRVLATAVRAGVTKVLLFWPGDGRRGIRQECAADPELRGLEVQSVGSFALDPRQRGNWAAIGSLLEDEFLWLPWNFVTSSRRLAAIRTSAVLPVRWSEPVRLVKDSISRIPLNGTGAAPEVDGVSLYSPDDAPAAEKFLVANSGKATDGFYSNFNRRLSRPFVRALTHTSITPNMVTLAGLLVAIVSAFIYARGSYRASVAGAVLFFISGLIDEMDGMLARLKFLESAFGTWFEGFVDNATYLLLFSGITAGLYRQHGKGELAWGAALIVGCVLSVILVAMQRKLVTAPDRPNEYSARMNRIMERDSGPIARISRQIHIFIKKGVAVHYVLIFTVLGALPVFLRIAAISANLTWCGVLYFTWKLTHTHRDAVLEPTT